MLKEKFFIKIFAQAIIFTTILSSCAFQVIYRESDELNKAAYEIIGISVENFAQSLLEDGIDISKPENKITYYNLL